MKRSPYAGLFNLLTVLVLGVTLLFCLFAGVTFVNPQIFFNPLKPNNDLPALLPTVPTPVPTASPVKHPTLPPVWTATPAASNTAAATSTRVVTATATAGPTATHTPFPTAVGPTATLTPSALPASTATLKPPRPTATEGSYPGEGTATPPGATDTPVGYP
jgi:hypothetical protein